MKRLTVFASSICAAVLLYQAVLAASPGRERDITGVVIYLSNNIVEIKRGSRELVLRHAADTAYTGRDGSAVDRTALGLCQTVRARYISECGRCRLVSIQVISEGECYRP